MGFEDGYDPDFAGGDIVNPDYPSEHLAMKVCEYKPYDLDYEFLNMPYYNDGEVWDTDISFSYDDIDSTVDWLIKSYYSIVSHATYKVTVEFNGATATYDTSCLDEYEAEEEALDMAFNDLEVTEINPNGTTVVFNADFDNAKVYSEYSADGTESDDDLMDIADEVMYLAQDDLEVVSTESELTW